MGWVIWAVTQVVLLFAVIGGWIWNIVKLVQHVGPVAEWSAMEITRCIGIFVPPLGVVMGYL